MSIFSCIYRHVKYIKCADGRLPMAIDRGACPAQVGGKRQKPGGSLDGRDVRRRTTDIRCRNSVVLKSPTQRRNHGLRFKILNP